MNIDPSGHITDVVCESISYLATVNTAKDMAVDVADQEYGKAVRKGVVSGGSTILGATKVISPQVGLVITAIDFVGNLAIDYLDRKIAEYDRILEQNKRNAAAFSRQNQGNSGTSSNEWRSVISYTDRVTYIVEIRSPYNPDSHIMDFLDYALYLENGTPLPANNIFNKTHQTVSKNLLQKRAYAKKKAYMQEKMKRYEHLRNMLIERMKR
jgi:hypothetical protein